MSKIAMFTMGTRGDVQPYIFLSKGLIRRGHEVTLGSHPCWRTLIEDAGIKFVPIGPDIDIEHEAAVIRGKTASPALSMLKTINFVFRIVQDSTREIYEVCKGKDLIVVSHSQMGATEAEVLGIPTVNVTLQKEMIGEPLRPKSFKDKTIGNMISRQVAKPYNKIRRVYGLRPIKTADELVSTSLNLVPISKYVLPRNPFWAATTRMTGYWYIEAPEFFSDQKLIDFVNAGEPPIILALGAMSFEAKEERDKLDMFVHAFQKTGSRAIIQGFQKTLANYKLPPSMIACGSVPHSWLFRHGKYVIHHAGFGTAASAMIYGIPSIPVPHVLDQMGFAQQLYDNGVATKPIAAKELSEQAIIDAIEEMNRTLDDKKFNAGELADKLRTENGVAEAVRLIEDAIR